jgi:hypothetical protein
MFWSEEQLQQLVGTDIESVSEESYLRERLVDCPDRIGKTEAEIEYREKVMPVLKVRLRFT